MVHHSVFRWFEENKNSYLKSFFNEMIRIRDSNHIFLKRLNCFCDLNHFVFRGIRICDLILLFVLSCPSLSSQRRNLNHYSFHFPIIVWYKNSTSCVLLWLHYFDFLSRKTLADSDDALSSDTKFSSINQLLILFRLMKWIWWLIFGWLDQSTFSNCRKKLNKK